MEKFLRLEAVVELSSYKEDLPKWDLPDYKLLDSIPLWKGISFDEISLVIAQVACYNDNFDLKIDNNFYISPSGKTYSILKSPGSAFYPLQGKPISMASIYLLGQQIRYKRDKAGLIG